MPSYRRPPPPVLTRSGKPSRAIFVVARATPPSYRQLWRPVGPSVPPRQTGYCVLQLAPPVGEIMGRAQHRCAALVCGCVLLAVFGWRWGEEEIAQADNVEKRRHVGEQRHQEPG